MLVRLADAQKLEHDGQFELAESIYQEVSREWPTCATALQRLAYFALKRGTIERAIGLLESATAACPERGPPYFDLAVALLADGRTEDAIARVELGVARVPTFAPLWLILGELRSSTGNRFGALKAWNRAISMAQRNGQWRDADTTAPALLESVLNAIEQLRLGRRELLFGLLDELRVKFGGRTLVRVEKALRGYFGDPSVAPTDSRQRPRFLFIPDLPSEPYLDPCLQPWSNKLRDGFESVRMEALAVARDDGNLADFIRLRHGDSIRNYLGGSTPAPSWEAFFFYRHGQKYDDNFVKCPRTGELLESIETCKIADHAPEICFSVLRPGTHILPHRGVTNSRVVMHLPLVVPSDCALNIVGVGARQWKEAELLMFDDTFEHEAWNRSSSTRIILLMDCWNPHLDSAERDAIGVIIETIGAWHHGGRPGSEAT